MRIVPSFLFSVISYFMIGFTRTGAQFFFFLLTVFISSLFGSAMCFFLSATISVFGKPIVPLACQCLSIFVNCSAGSDRHHSGSGGDDDVQRVSH